MGEYKHFRLLRNLSEEGLEHIAERLMRDYLYVSDEDRTPRKVWSELYRVLSGDPAYGAHIAYEIGDSEGLLLFRDIIRGFKCAVSLKYWDPSHFGPGLVREARRLIDGVADGLHLSRMNTETADPRIVKLAKMVGFVVEGEKTNDFMWEGKLYTRYLLGRVFSRMEV